MPGSGRATGRGRTGSSIGVSSRVPAQRGLPGGPNRVGETFHGRPFTSCFSHAGCRAPSCFIRPPHCKGRRVRTSQLRASIGLTRPIPYRSRSGISQSSPSVCACNLDSRQAIFVILSPVPSYKCVTWIMMCCVSFGNRNRLKVEPVVTKV